MITAHTRPFNPWASPYPDPRVDIRQLLRGFETSSEAKKEGVIRVQSLRQKASAPAVQLADTLEACERGSRCLLSICPVCSRRFRLWWCGQALELMAGHSDLVFVTLIDASQAIPANGLAQLNPNVYNDRLRHQLLRRGVRGPILGGVDLDVDEDYSLLQLHHHLVASAGCDAAFRDIRNRFYSKTGQAHFPVVIQPVEDRPKQTSYCIKAYCLRKYRYRDRSGKTRIGYARLKEPMQADWLLWRSRFSSAEFAFHYGVRRIGHLLVP
jgi:hypothetical protein